MDNCGILRGKKVLVLVTGSIAVYKTLDLISSLKKLHAEIAVVMSDDALEFIKPLTFEAISNRAVLYKGVQSYAKNNPINHIAYATWADIAVVAPASINSIAKLRYGISDNIVIETILACTCKVLVAPSGNINMLESKQNKQNIESLHNMGYPVIPPRETLLACNVVAKGAMADINEIIFNIQRELSRDSFWQDKSIVITGGGSIEQIDTIRHISNNSSGLQSSNLAIAFYLLGAKVKLISSKFPIQLPIDIEQIHVTSSADYKHQLQDTDETIVIMAAAISDYIIKNPQKSKIRKSDIGEVWNLRLNQNQDILSDIKCKFKVAFKAETDSNIGEYSAKNMLKNINDGGKGCDMVLLNIINEDNEIGSIDNYITILTKHKKIEIPKQHKLKISFCVAEAIKNEILNV